VSEREVSLQYIVAVTRVDCRWAHDVCKLTEYLTNHMLCYAMLCYDMLCYAMLCI
jgi:hypothetical protein